MGNLSLLIGNDTINSRLDRRQAHAQSSIQSQGRRLRACGHATHARTFDYTQHMEVRYKLESVEKQHKQARVYINGPQTLIKRSPEVMGCSPKC